jgi:hypothetical protein
MKAKKKIVGIINFVILAGTVALGAWSGHFTGNYRIGIHIGMAVGLIGIALFRLWREKAQASLKDVKILRSNPKKRPSRLS